MIAVWTWSVAVLTSAAVTYTWGISGLFWFVVSNGLAIMLLAPFALHLRKKLPAGYTITQFIKERFNNPAATAAVLAVIVFTAGMSILLNALGAVIVLKYDLRHSAAGHSLGRAGDHHHLLVLRRSLDISDHGYHQHAAVERACGYRSSLSACESGRSGGDIQQSPSNQPPVFQSLRAAKQPLISVL